MPKHSESIEECSRIFVSWRWLVSIVASIVGVGIVAGIAYAGRETNQEACTKRLEEKSLATEVRVKTVEEEVKRYITKQSLDMDTVKSLLRGLK